MRRLALLAVLVLFAFTAWAAAPVQPAIPPAGPVPNTFFGLHINRAITEWPAAPFGSIRLWDTGTGWAQINRQPGRYNWQMLDRWLEMAKQHSVDVMYTMGRTPVWAQCGPDTPSRCEQAGDPPGSNCAYNANAIPMAGGNGQCYWPGDLNTDGSGSNQHWKDWVTALATHSAGLGGNYAHIRFYEIWNEVNVSPPNGGGMWQGTYAQLARMTRDAKCIIQGVGPDCRQKGIDPTAVIVSPSPVMGINGVSRALNEFFERGGGPASDVIALHSYVGPTPEDMGRMADVIRRETMTSHGQQTKELFSTEGSWGARSGFFDQDLRAGYIARAYLSLWANGISRFYWYIWEDLTVEKNQPNLNRPGNPMQRQMEMQRQMQGRRPPGMGPGGRPGEPLPGMPMGMMKRGCDPEQALTGSLCKSAVAFGETVKWMVGAVMSEPCRKTGPGDVWACGFKRSDPANYHALAIWDAGKTCSQGKCETRDLSVDKQYLHYRDLEGKTFPIANHSVPVGYKPVLLENR